MQPFRFWFWSKMADFHCFSLIFTVFDLSRPLEGHYGPGLVLGRDILVVYGVCVLSSTWKKDNITLISRLCKDDFGSKWPIFTDF